MSVNTSGNLEFYIHFSERGESKEFRTSGVFEIVSEMNVSIFIRKLCNSNHCSSIHINAGWKTVGKSVQMLNCF